MAYTVISQNNTTTTLADENGNVIHVPARVTLATSTDYTITKVNNSTATLVDGDGNTYRDVPCCVVLAGADEGVTSINGQTGDVVLTASDVGAADTSLSNLTNTGKNIANWSINVTNCLTQIPQDITLTLSSGTLTLKAGSKCYLKTDTTTPSITVASDLTTTQTTDGTYFAIYDGSDLTTILTTAYDYSTLPDTYSLPLGVVTVSSGTITSIDNVFNGFGYIGSQVFTLPGVNGLYPNGRNADGTLKNGLVNCTTVQISSVFSDSGQHCLFLQSNGRCQWYFTNQFYYDETLNEIRASLNNVKLSAMDAGTFITTSGVISDFKPKTVFQANYELPAQRENAGKVLMTNSTSAYWGAPSALVKTISSATAVQALANGYVYNCTTNMTSLEITLPGTLTADFACQINFTSGSTPTAFTSPVGMVWLGDDCTGSAFVPVASTRYSIMVFFDGVSTRGIVQAA